MKIIPMSEMVLTTNEKPEEKTAGGIIIPETHTKNMNIGVVLKVGTDEELCNIINPGDKIVFNPQGVETIEIEKVSYKIVHKLNILAVLKEN